MQVANTLNNSIRILFNPRVENFNLFDFLVVKSDDSRYIAQIVEIYDDKFDASQNVAKLKLFYRITENNEVMPYDNFTPNKECEISKIKPEEIESFVNQDKETFVLGTNIKNSCGLNIQYDFFNNNPVVLADKIENATCITYNLAKKLSQKKNVVIIDTTGVLELEGAKKIKASKNFKMPLNYSTIDHVFNRCLYDATLEFQAIGGEIINEIKKFARKQEDNFIPFNLLTRVLIQQHKATPYPELKLLLVRLKKHQMDEVFARTKAEKEALFKAIEKNPITIIDLSGLESYWQKTYLNYIVSEIEQEIYLITRINDEQFSAELINKIYNKKKNINFVPNVSYNYKKLPSVMQHCKNYILMPSLTQRADFLDANFALSNLISEGCIVFGENTDGFLYLVKDYELEIQEKRKNYRKIALTLVQQEAQQNNLGEKGDYFENKAQEEMSDSARLIKELSDFEASQKENIQEKEEETFEEIVDPTSANELSTKENIEDDLIFNPEKEVEIKKETQDDFQDLAPAKEIQEEDEDVFEDILKEEQKEQEEPAIQEEELETSQEEIKIEEETLIQEEKIEEIITQAPVINIEEKAEEIIEEETKEVAVEEIIVEEATQAPATEEETKKEDLTQELDDDIPVLDDDLSDEELDFFQMAQDSEDEEDLQEESEEDDIDLSAIADDSIDDNFEEIINTKNQQAAPTIAVDKDTKINADILETNTQKENLPIFKEEEPKDNNVVFNIGNIIVHKKYGKGTVVKTIKYEERQLLQIEFEEAGKKLLDPKVADIKLEQ
ncbi:MAG: hypothetical protein IJB79_05600 [Candidatus Gastranaerophilales bacterium]|nr:hypothetical protein [Candidatus Gastranaerophilales bacterium]